MLKRTDLMLETDLQELETKSAVAGLAQERGFPYSSVANARTTFWQCYLLYVSTKIISR